MTVAQTAASEGFAFDLDGVLVGQMLTGYGEIEYELAALVVLACDSAPLHLNAIFKMNRQAVRLEILDALLRPRMIEKGLLAKYAQTYEAVEFCRTVFNQYDCCHWFRNDGELNFLDLEAPRPQADSAQLFGRVTDSDLLSAQLAHFDYARACLRHLQEELKAARPDDAVRRRRWPMPHKRVKPDFFRSLAAERPKGSPARI